MSVRDPENIPPIGLDDLLKAYMLGYFPMADARDDPRLYWVAPERRGVLPLDAVHVPRRLRRTVRRNVFEVRVDAAFGAVMAACAAPAPGRENTWINGQIFDLYTGLHERGFAHSVECWSDGELKGGLYGVALGGAFFGESMFSRQSDASKVALVHLVARLKAGGFILLDTQFKTEHLGQFGVTEVSKEAYMARLEAALAIPADWGAIGDHCDGARILQSITQTS